MCFAFTWGVGDELRNSRGPTVLFICKLRGDMDDTEALNVEGIEMQT